jgi:outer membrane murein-binding lipoprotein Lpp
MTPALALAGVRALPWKIIGICAAGLFVAALILALKMERVHSAKLQLRVTELTNKLDDLAAQSKAAQERSAKALKEAKRNTAKVEIVARQIETPRPLSGRCETPQIVRSADI